jgi:hypothetical protein
MGMFFTDLDCVAQRKYVNLPYWDKYTGEGLVIFHDDAATKRWLYYLSGDDTENANAIKALIVPARAAIKSEIPDAE